MSNLRKMTKDISTWGGRIRYVRKASGLTQDVFGQIIGRPAQDISNIETGRVAPSCDLLAAILKKFPDVNADWLLLGDEAPRRRSQVTPFHVSRSEFAIVKIIREQSRKAGKEESSTDDAHAGEPNAGFS